MKFNIFIIALLCLAGPAQSQNTLTGKVTDKQTGEPVPYANVFFAYTTQGAASLIDGTFEISRIPDGSYDLLVEVVGYRRHKETLEFKGGEYRIEITIQEETQFLDSITVVADQSDKRYYPLFVKFFIGDGSNAKLCEILNRDALHFLFDKGRNSLSVSARRPIVINNPALGYKVHYTLDRFEIDFNTGTKIFEGSPRFEEMPLKKKKDSVARAKKRDLAYQGSLFHLMRSLYENTATQEGFSFFEADSSKDPEAQPPQSALRKLKPVEFISGEGVKKLGFSGLLKVEYKAREASEYPGRTQGTSGFKGVSPGELSGASRSRNPHGRQQTYVKLSSGSLDIYENGYYADPRTVYLTGYLVWRETICNMVPISHQLSVKKKG